MDFELASARLRAMGHPTRLRILELLARSGCCVGEIERQLDLRHSRVAADRPVEADTFLSDRRGAQHPWERSQANEFLQQLESCRGFVAVTTTLYPGLDPAVLRAHQFRAEKISTSL